MELDGEGLIPTFLGVTWAASDDPERLAAVYHLNFGR